MSNPLCTPIPDGPLILKVILRVQMTQIDKKNYFSHILHEKILPKNYTIHNSKNFNFLGVSAILDSVKNMFSEVKIFGTFFWWFFMIPSDR